MEPISDPHLRIFNPEGDQTRPFPNAMFIYEDDPANPIFVLIAIGHIVNLGRHGVVPFENGSQIKTMPFRVQDGRLGKRVSALAQSDWMSLRQYYGLSETTGISILQRMALERAFEEQFDEDVELYTQRYQSEWEQEIVDKCNQTEVESRKIKMNRPEPSPILFSTQPLPPPTESPIYTTDYHELGPEVTVFGTLWNLLRSGGYWRAISNVSKPEGLAPARAVVHMRSKSEGSWCLGIEIREALGLADKVPEIAHFHRVAVTEDSAVAIGRRLASELKNQFDMTYEPQVYLNHQPV